ncbi:hypothetical protein QJS10_CPB17g01363 [Acorus calamus]|uniref:Uncharacterized protein n=1 Tax=Acorus calamus TaxID=4465 RepID=A0AAV9CSW5_ACOCL|nr:hypothetical protein QJS10_CPB17g01363 [Acorus calamus]
MYIILPLYGGVTDKKAVEESAAKLEKKPPKASLVTDRPHVNAWWKAISSRPAVQVIAGMTLGNCASGRN